MKTFFTIMLILPFFALAQEDDPLKYFPHKTGDMWEYYWDDKNYPDTLQNFTTMDSVDADGNIYIKQEGRFINPTKPSVLISDTSYYKIDTSYNVFLLGSSSGLQNVLAYKLNARQGEQWVMVDMHGAGYEMCRVFEIREEEWFGKQTTAKVFVYYFAQDSTDTLGLVRYGDVLVKGFGLVNRGGLDAVGVIQLKGCVLNNILYGDTTAVITTVADLQLSHPDHFEIFPNYPNPFNPTTTISFVLRDSENISLIVYNAMGKEIRKLIDNEWHNTGMHKIIWDSKNSIDQIVPSGVYYYRLINNTNSITRSMILLK